MPRDPSSIILESVVASKICDRTKTETAREVERDLLREGFVILPAAMAALVASLVNGLGHCGEVQERLVGLGLAVRTAYDPERHGDSENLLPGDSYIEWAPALKFVLSQHAAVSLLQSGGRLQ